MMSWRVLSAPADILGALEGRGGPLVGVQGVRKGRGGGGRRGDVEGGKGDDEKAVGNRCSAFAARGRQACSSSPVTSDTSMVASDEHEDAIDVFSVCKYGILYHNAYD